MNDLIRSARQQGLSDGYHGYPGNPGDFTGDARHAYTTAYADGVERRARQDAADYAATQATESVDALIDGGF